MKFNYIYGKQAEQYDYLYIPKAFMKEELFKSMTASAKIMYAVLMEKQQKSVEMGWIDEKFSREHLLEDTGKHSCNWYRT